MADWFETIVDNRRGIDKGARRISREAVAEWTPAPSFKIGDRVTIANMPVFKRRPWWAIWAPKWREVGRQTREMTIIETVSSGGVYTMAAQD